MVYLTVKNYLLSLLKMRHKQCGGIVLIIIFSVNNLSAQQYNLLRHIPIDIPQHATIDLLGQIYLQTTGGRITKYDLNGELLYDYQDADTRFVTILDAGSSLRLLAFYKDRQSYQYFDRTLTPSPILHLQNAQSGFFSLATASADNSIWLWDATQLQLKKYKPALGDFTAEISTRYYLDDSADVNQISEYQNKLYVNDNKNEILVFDILGNYIQKLPLTNVAHFNFVGDELYWRKGSSMYLYHLYNMQSRKINLPDMPAAEKIFAVFLKEDRMIVIAQKEMFIYRLLRH